VQHAFVLVNAGLCEGHAEAGRAQRGLWQTNTILRRLCNKPRVYSVRRRADEGVAGAVSIRGDVGRRRNLVKPTLSTAYTREGASKACCSPSIRAGPSLSFEVTREKHERPFVVFAPSLVAQLHQQNLSPTSHKPVRTIFVVVGAPVGQRRSRPSSLQRAQWPRENWTWHQVA
jgi:hypothetical protein